MCFGPFFQIVEYSPLYPVGQFYGVEFGPGFGVSCMFCWLEDRTLLRRWARSGIDLGNQLDSSGSVFLCQSPNIPHESGFYQIIM